MTPYPLYFLALSLSCLRAFRLLGVSDAFLSISETGSICPEALVEKESSRSSPCSALLGNRCADSTKRTREYRYPMDLSTGASRPVLCPTRVWRASRQSRTKVHKFSSGRRTSCEASSSTSEIASRTFSSSGPSLFMWSAIVLTYPAGFMPGGIGEQVHTHRTRISM